MSTRLLRRGLAVFLAVAIVLTTILLSGVAANTTTPVTNLFHPESIPLQNDHRADVPETLTVDESIHIYHTLDLASDISVNFAVPATALTGYDSFYLECVLPKYEGNTQTGTTTVHVEPKLTGSYYYFTLTGITAVQMGDMVEAVLHMTKGDANYISKTDSYSVATYAYSMLGKSTDPAMLTLCADLLRYGSEAQTFKGYRTNALVDTAMTEAQRSYFSDTISLTFTPTDSILGDLASPTIAWVGKSLDLGSKVGVKFVFKSAGYTGDIANLSMRVSYKDSYGQDKSITLTDAEVYNLSMGYYSFSFYGLLASELRTVLDMAIYEGDIRCSETLRYSVETYASKHTIDALAPLCKALFAYSDSAREFFKPSTYSVTFKDWDGTVLKTETVESGKSATAPSVPTRKGYVFAGWDKAFTNVTSDLVVTATYTQITTPTILISDETAKAGDKIVVTFDLINSPLLYAMSLKVAFDDTALTLVSAESGEAMNDFIYTGPSRLRNGSNFIWFANDPATGNGTILKLTFMVNEGTAAGAYPVTMTCDSGNTLNAAGEDVHLEFVYGNIVVAD